MIKTGVALCLLASVAVAGPKKDAVVTVAKDVKWTALDPKAGDKGPMLSVISGDVTKKAPIVFLLKLPPDGRPGPHTHTSDDYATIVQGTMHNFKAPGTDEGPAVTPGGTWFQPGGEPHDNHCEASSKDGCILMVYMPTGFDVKPWVDPAAKKDAPKKDAPKTDKPAAK
jgi:quercetin dioxygenase-like cupin family protein